MRDVKFVSYHHANRSGYGLVKGEGIIALGEKYQQEYFGLRQAISAEALNKLIEENAHKSPDIALREVKFDLPITDPGKIICVGVNYPDRNAEYKDGQQAPSYPSLFVRFASSFVGAEQPLIRPKVSTQLDYEGEIVLIIGKAGRHIPESQALEHVAGLSLCNEGSVRDWIRHGKFNVTQGKNFDHSASMGPWLVPFWSEEQIADISLTAHVNGELRQQDRTSRMIFNFRQLIHYISTFTTLEPGDLIITGTPTGAGARFDPPVYLQPGDIVEIAADGLGILRNSVMDER